MALEMKSVCEKCGGALHPARIGFQLAREQAQQRGLAGPVEAHESQARAGRQSEAQVAELKKFVDSVRPYSNVAIVAEDNWRLAVGRLRRGYQRFAALVQ